MRHRIYLIILVAITLGGIARAHADEMRACDFKVKARCASGDARVTLDGGAIKRIEVNVFFCGLQGRPGYSCGIDSSRGDPDSKWSEEGGATVIDNVAPFNASQPDRVKVTAGRYVSIDMAQAQAQSPGRCGAGAELPRAIVIPEKKGACRVWLGE